MAWSDVLRDADLPGVVDIVPASRTVLLKLDGPRYQAPTRQRLSKLRLRAGGRRGATAPIDGRADVVIDVVYDGADLDEVGELTGLDVDRTIVAAHTETPWRVGFGGFAPGFAYLVGGDERLQRAAAVASHAPRCPPGRSGWPASSAASTRASRPAAGS